MGDLCLPKFGTPKTVQLLVHGGTYGRTYWDFPYQPGLYSYREYANAAGYATFSVDSVGVGESSKPHSSQITMAATAKALHDVITKLRAGNIGPVAFQKVIWVGHSMGSVTAWQGISTYGDVDAFIATGAVRPLSAAATNLVLADVIPASQDPKFAPLNLDAGYLAINPPARQAAFCYLPTVDPQVLAVDADNRQPLTVGPQVAVMEMLTASVQNSASVDITVPVLSVIGAKDNMYCAVDALDCTDYAAVQQAEAPYYANASDFDLIIVPETGHNLNLHYTAPFTFLSMLSWAATHVAP
ncbi:alpha/beta hydrolase [Micromonospora sp. CPCC 206060]|uniref:alpha/beta hydrolase n=1 Tax=Micromonospora sp. CPCC 206060 TaxID=3122406 RepID=UPI002FF1D4B7